MKSQIKPHFVEIRTIWILVQAIIFSFMLPTITILSHFNSDTWGETVKLHGWIIVGIVFIVSVFFTITYSRSRLTYISKWKFTTKHGVMCFFEPNTNIYTIRDIEDATEEMFLRWQHYLQDQETVLPHPSFTRTITCIFRPEDIFRPLTLRDSLVHGVSGRDWIIIGTGNKPIEKTAYIHECSHIYMSDWKKRYVSDNEAHELFKKVGV